MPAPVLIRCTAVSNQNGQLEEDKFDLAVTIPANTEGVVRLPAQSVADITEQGQSLDKVDGIREIRQEGETVILTLGSGHYQLSTKMRKTIHRAGKGKIIT